MSRRITRSVGVLGMLLLMLMAAAPALAYHDDPNEDHVFADPAFRGTWQRTDKLVAESGEDAPRTWIWGPEPYTPGMQERYDDSPGGTRLVQYFDKSRMEINCPDDEPACSEVDRNSPWYVTNGLLVVEMVEGHYQVGDAAFNNSPQPADINIVGDPGERPTYADINTYELRDEPAAANGAILNKRFNDDGTITTDTSFNDENVTAAYRVTVPEIDHQVASVFWTFMNSTGQVWENGQYVTDTLFENPFYATGYPITEGYWSTVAVGGTERDVFWQCFERRCLTYTPGNPAGFLVEAGNVGQHYYRWRHGDDEPAPDALLFDATLNGENERPNPVETDATGRAWFYLDGDTLRFQLEVADIENVTAAHIHLGEADDTGGVLVPLFMTEDESEWFSGTGVLASGEITADMLPEDTTWNELLELMETGGVYVNVHTDQNPPGEIRGQIMVSDDVELEADLNGTNEEPDVTTDATGSASFTFDHDTDSVDFSLSVASINNVTAAHIHLGEADETGPVIAPLFTPATPVDPEDGELASGTLMADDLMNDLEGEPIERLVWEMVTHNTYVNVHTQDHPTGEIRGQIMLATEAPPPGPESYTVMLFGLNGSGVMGTATIDEGDGGSWNVSMDLTGLETGDHPVGIMGKANPVGTVAYCPTAADDENTDGFLTFPEGAQAFGSFVFEFEDLTAGGDGTASVTDLSVVHEFDSPPLQDSVMVVTGLTADPDGEGPEEPAYDETVPVACGLIVPNNEDGFIAELNGDNVQPDAVETETTGHFVARVSADGSTLSWALHFVDAEMINDTRIFDDRTATEDETLVVLHSFHSVAPFEGTGQFWSGLVTDDSIPGDDLTLEELLDLMRAGDTYVQAGLADGMDGYDALVRGDIVTMGAWVAQ